MSIGSRVSFLATEDRGFKLAVALDVSLPQVEDPERAVPIIAAAHEVCPYSNTTPNTVDLQLTATDGQSSRPGPGSRGSSWSPTDSSGEAAIRRTRKPMPSLLNAEEIVRKPDGRTVPFDTQRQSGPSRDLSKRPRCVCTGALGPLSRGGARSARRVASALRRPGRRFRSVHRQVRSGRGSPAR